MSKRGQVGRAFTLLAAVGIIAFVMLIFLLASSTAGFQKVYDVRANVDALSTAGQLRLFLSGIADNPSDCQAANALVREAYGASATVAIFIEGRRACGPEISSPDGSIEAVLPVYGGRTMRVRVEVKRS